MDNIIDDETLKYMSGSCKLIYDMLKKRIDEDCLQEIIADPKLQLAFLVNPVRDMLFRGQSPYPKDYHQMLYQMLLLAIDYIDICEDMLADAEATIKDMEAERN